jgi:hypothetical protein
MGQVDSASATGVTFVTNLIDIEEYLANIRAVTLTFTPGQRSKCYNEIYKGYVATCEDFMRQH